MNEISSSKPFLEETSKTSKLVKSESSDRIYSANLIFSFFIYRYSSDFEIIGMPVVELPGCCYQWPTHRSACVSWTNNAFRIGVERLQRFLALLPRSTNTWQLPRQHIVPRRTSNVRVAA